MCWIEKGALSKIEKTNVEVKQLDTVPVVSFNRANTAICFPDMAPTLLAHRYSWYAIDSITFRVHFYETKILIFLKSLTLFLQPRLSCHNSHFTD